MPANGGAATAATGSAKPPALAPAGTANDPARRASGVGLFLIALLCFACYDAFAKAMVAQYPPALVNLGRYLAVSAMAAVWLWLARAQRPWRQLNQGLLWLRALMLAITATSFMTALVTMPLAEATAIYFTAPLAMVALSPWLLQERPTRWQWGAVLAGFAGMLLIVRPGSSLPLAGTLLMSVAALCYALFQLLTRRLSGRAPAPAQFASMAGLCLVVTNLPAWLGPPLAWPGWPALGLLVGGGLVSGLAQLLLLAAFQRAPLTTLAPLNYLQLLLAVLISSFWFHRPPDSLALAGMAVIAAAGVTLGAAARPAARIVHHAPGD